MNFRIVTTKRKHSVKELSLGSTTDHLRWGAAAGISAKNEFVAVFTDIFHGWNRINWQIACYIVLYETIEEFNRFGFTPEALVHQLRVADVFVGWFFDAETAWR